MAARRLDSASLRQLLIQERAAQERMAKLDDYAASVGCVVIGDEIVCTSAQLELLKAFWMTPDA